jgi:hypothetical protein
MRLGLHWCEHSAQECCEILSTAQKFVAIKHAPYSQFYKTDLTKNHTPALSTVRTYRVLLLRIVFILI